MAIIRVEKTNNFTMMTNYHLRDVNLSLKAIGLLSKILSLPEGWDYSVDGLASICKENGTAIRSALKELEEYGYLERRMMRNDKGLIDYEYYIYEKPKYVEEPYIGQPYTENPHTDKPYTDEPHTDEPYAENRTQLNTDKLSTEELSTDKLSTEYIAQSDQDVSEQDVIVLPLAGNDEFIVQPDFIEEMSKCYPSVDIEGELKKMRAWCISNPKKRKTKNGITRFINSWLAKEQDRGPRRNYYRQQDQFVDGFPKTSNPFLRKLQEIEKENLENEP